MVSVYFLNFLYFGLLIPFFRWIYSFNSLFERIGVLICGGLLPFCFYYSFDFTIEDENNAIPGIIFYILHFVYVIVAGKRTPNGWLIPFLICLLGCILSCFIYFYIEKTEQEKLDARINAEKKIMDELFSSKEIKLRFVFGDKERIGTVTVSNKKGLSHDLEFCFCEDLSGFKERLVLYLSPYLSSYISGSSDLDLFFDDIIKDLYKEKTSVQIIKKGDRRWVSLESKEKLTDSVLELYFSVSNSDRFSENAEIILTTLNRNGETTKTSLGEYKRVKRKNGSLGFVVSDLKLNFKPELLKILNDAFSSYIQTSDRMNFCEVVIDELLTQGFSEQVFTRIEDESQDNSSSGEANEEDESSYYFGILGLRKDASLQDVERSYKEMMKFWHPDQFAGNKKKQAEAEERCKQLNVAYSWLKEFFQA